MGKTKQELEDKLELARRRMKRLARKGGLAFLEKYGREKFSEMGKKSWLNRQKKANKKKKKSK